MDEPQYDEMDEATKDLLKKLDDNRIKDLKESRQHCPICGDKVLESERYPIYVCGKDVERATDENNRILVFGNASAAGGFMAYYKDDMTVAEGIMKSHRVYIDGVVYDADERYMGGTVVTPISSNLINKALYTVLKGTPTQLPIEVKTLLDYGKPTEVTIELTDRLLFIVEEVSKGKIEIPVWEFKGNSYLPFPSWLSGVYRELTIKSPSYLPSLSEKDGIVYLLAVLASLRDLSQVIQN